MTTNIRLPHANCPACELSHYRNNGPAAYEGPDDPQVIFVGAGLGEHEARFRRPFIGPSGQLLRGTADLFGTGRYGLTNVVSCRPPNNGDPSPQMIHACSGRLRAELERFPGVPLVALGEIALRVLLPNNRRPMKEIDGCWLKGPDGKDVMACYHPTYVLQKAVHYPSFRQALENAFLPPVTLHSPRVAYKIVDNFDDLHWAHALCWTREDTEWWLQEAPPVALDIETTGLGLADEITCIQLAWDSDTAWIIPHSLVTTPECRSFLKTLFEEAVIVGHNLKFDLARLMHRLDLAYPRRIFDTMLAYYAHNEQGLVPHPDKDQKDKRSKSGFKLKAILKRMFGVEYGHSGDWAVDWTNPKAVQAHYEYAAADAAYTFKLYERLHRGADQRETRLCEEILFPLNKVLLKMELGGIRFDVAAAEENLAYFDGRVEELTGQVRNVLIEELHRRNLPLHILEEYADFKPTQTTKLQKLLYDVLGLPRQYKSDKKTGRVSQTADKASLKTLLDLDPSNSIIPLVMQYRPVRKLSGTYVKGALTRLTDDYVHPTFYPLNETGRLSSENPNMQNLPRGDTPDAKRVKRQYRADVGHVIVEADFSQAELRELARLSLDPSMLESFRQGRDIHTDTAVIIYRDVYGKDLLELAAAPEGSDAYKEYDTFRSFTKRATFGIAYRITPKALAELIWNEMKLADREALTRKYGSAAAAWEVVLAQATAIHAAWHKMRPAVREFQERLINQALEDGYIQTPFGRRRHIGFLPPFGVEQNHLYNELVNFPIQSVGSGDLVIVSMIRLDDWIEARNFPARILVPVHDSIASSCLAVPEVVEEFVTKKRDTMVGVAREFLGETVPFAVDFKVGLSWGTAQKCKTPADAARITAELMQQVEVAA